MAAWSPACSCTTSAATATRTCTCTSRSGTGCSADQADEKWRTLDSRSLHNQRLAVAPVTDRILETRLSALGYAMVPRADGNGAEVGGVSQDVIDLFSSRSRALTPELKTLISQYQTAHGRPPSKRTIWLLGQQAAQNTRRTKAEARRIVAGQAGTAEPTEAQRLAACRVLEVQQDRFRAAHLAVGERHAETAPPDRQHRFQVAVAALQLSLARRRGHLAGVIEQARFLASPASGPSDEDISLGSDLRAVALMNLGIAEAWSLGLPDAPDAERHLREGADLARQIGRPILEVACLARLGFASLVLRSFATTQAPCREAIALAEQHGWGAEPVIAPALVRLADTLVWTGEFDEGERWLRRTEPALQRDTGPDITLLLHQTAGLLHAGRGRHNEALEEFGAAEDLASQLADSHALASQVTGWLLATQARLGMTGEGPRLSRGAG